MNNASYPTDKLAKFSRQWCRDSVGIICLAMYSNAEIILRYIQNNDRSLIEQPHNFKRVYILEKTLVPVFMCFSSSFFFLP